MGADDSMGGEGLWMFGFWGVGCVGGWAFGGRVVRGS
jgi:hypothetical protein